MRLRVLDAVRGLAAFAVLLHHNLLSAPAPLKDALAHQLGRTPLAVIATGRPAVILFFVLSGVVLTLSLGGPHISFGGYVLKRSARIYLPFAASILFAAGLCAALGNTVTHSGSGWLDQVWALPLTPAAIGASLTTLGRPQELLLNPVVWSLWYELRLSLLLPLILWLATVIGSVRLGLATLLLAVAVEGAMRARAIWSNPTYATQILDAVLITLHFLPLFVAGLLIARHARQIVDGVARLQMAAVLALWLVAIVSLCRFSDLYTAIGAVLIVALTIASPRVTGWLENGPCLWLGRVSFSLYLIHVPVICVVYRLAPGLPWPVKTVLVVVASLALAELGARYVERPAQHLGRWLATLTVRRPVPAA